MTNSNNCFIVVKPFLSKHGHKRTFAYLFVFRCSRLCQTDSESERERQKRERPRETDLSSRRRNTAQVLTYVQIWAQHTGHRKGG